MKRWGIVLLLCLGVVACSSDKKVAPKEGRIALQEAVVVPKARQNIKLNARSDIWTVDSTTYTSQNKKEHLKNLASSSNWEKSVGTNKIKNSPALPAPAIGKKNVYTLDGQFSVRAHQRTDGALVWETLLDKNETGLCLIKNGSRLLALSAKGKLAALDTDGKILWQKDLKAPFRNTPVIEKDNLYLLSANNDVWALNLKNGQEKWHYKTDAPVTFLQQMGTPAVSGKTIVVPFSSGIVIAFDKDTGSYLWEQDMSGSKSFDRIANMAQMTASPVIEGQTVYLVGHANKTGAFDLKDGHALWTLSQGGRLTPVISGNAVFILNSDNMLSAFSKNDGHLFWQTKIPEIKGQKGMYLLDNTLMVIGRESSLKLNAQNGQIEASLKTDFDGSVPVLAQDGWYYLHKNGNLIHQGQIQ